jgi:hypothetical protein
VLDVRAISYYPERVPVDVIAGDAPVRVALSSFQRVLDTVKVRATQRHDADYIGFQDRRRSGVGRYITPEDVARRNPIVTSDLFKNMAGVRYDSYRSPMLLVRGTTVAWCPASIYVDGHLMRNLSADDVDGWVAPDEIAGIEVYDSFTTPPQFRAAFDNCGAIVIWTSPALRTRPPLSLKQYGTIAALLIGLVYLSLRLR